MTLFFHLTQACLLLVSLASAESTASFFSQGVAAYTQADYAKASEFFLKALDENPQSSEVLTNLGLTEYKLGHIGSSLGFLRKALGISPYNSTAFEALKFATAQSHIKEIAHHSDFFEDLRRGFLLWIPFEGYLLLTAMLLLFSGWIWLGFWGRRKITQENEEAPPAFPFIGLFLSALCVLSVCLTLSKFIELSQVRATVLEDRVSAKLGPGDDQPVLFDLYEGIEVIQLRDDKDWAQVKYPGGLTGWVAKKSIMITSQRAPW